MWRRLRHQPRAELPQWRIDRPTAQRNGRRWRMQQCIWGQTVLAPMLDPHADDEDTEVRLDILVRGGSKEQTLTLIDVACVNADAASYSKKTTDTVLDAAASYKRNKYQKSAFKGETVPFTTTGDGAAARKQRHSIHAWNDH
eukprot:Selendium_serpulae@DN8194_c0_g1_i1.p1